MIQSMSKKLLLTTVILSVAGLVVGQEASDKKKGRLPKYYADIVTELQRVQIYAIQETYSKKITAIQEQLGALENQRDAEIEGVLDVQQKARLKLARESASAKRTKAAAEKKAADAKAAADKK